MHFIVPSCTVCTCGSAQPVYVLHAIYIQAKPLAVLPGSGMSIEVGVKGRGKVRLPCHVCFLDDHILVIIMKALLE